MPNDAETALANIAQTSNNVKAFVYTEMGKLAIQVGGWAVVGYMFVTELPKMRESYDRNTTAIVTSVNALTTELRVSNKEASKERDTIIKELKERNKNGNPQGGS